MDGVTGGLSSTQANRPDGARAAIVGRSRAPGPGAPPLALAGAALLPSAQRATAIPATTRDFLRFSAFCVA